MDEDTEYLKLPIEDQCVHKLWKARVHGYEAALKLFGQWEEKSPEWNKFTFLMKKIVIDSNAVAQEKGLETVLCFVENSAQASKTVGDVMSGLIAKCLGAPKARTKDVAIQIALMYVEIEKYEIVQEEILKGIAASKNPKVVAACIATLTQALREFGPKVINLKLVLKQVPVLLEDRDKNVREEGKKLVVELYRWIGQALKPQLSALKPIQVSELETEFEKLGNEKPHQTRFLRSQQDLKAKMEARMTEGTDATEEEADNADAVPDIDPYELLEPVDILSQLPKDFYDKCEAKKWQERKEAMDALEQLVANPKLQTGDYGDLVRALKKIIGKDSNVMVIAVAGKCLCGLANGLKKKFSPYALACIPTILEKFKEKKQNVVTAMREAIDAIYPSTTIEAIQEDVLASLDNKNPSVKAETAAFLGRCFAKCNATILNKKLLKAYCPALIKALNEPDPGVRDSSAEALGIAMKVVGEKVIMPFLPDLEAMKMAKIKECCEKAVVSGKPSGAAKPKTAPSMPESKEAAPKIADAAQKRPGAVIKKPTAAASGSGPAKKPAGKTAVKKAAGANAKVEEKIEKELSPEEVEEKAAAILPPDVITGITDANWKTRLGAMESMMQTIQTLERADIPTQVLVRTLCKKPGLKDNNFQVTKLKLEAVKFLAEKSDFSKRSAEYVINDVVDKLSDAKNGSITTEALTAIAEATSLDFVANQVTDFAMGQKNPKVQAEALVWLSNAIKEFGFVVQPKPIIETAKKGISATNPAVRTAAITLVGTLFLYMGPPLRTFFDGEKPALLQQLNTEFDKYTGQTPPAPIRGAAPKKQAEGEEEEPQEIEEVNVVDLIPRTDISGSITETIVNELNDKNWKVRNEALQKVTTILNDAKFITPQLGELPTALAARMSDSNTNLVQQALTIGQALAIAMGPNCRQHVRVLLPGFLQALSVNKPTVRATAISCLNTWVEQCNGMKEFFEGEVIADALKTGNPFVKADLLTWLAEKLPNVNAKVLNKDDVTACVPHLLAAIEDRTADVRKAAQDATLGFMIHLGYESMSRHASKLKPASKSIVQAHLDKVRPSLPTKPVVAAPQPVAKAKIAAQPSKEIPKEDDDAAKAPSGKALRAPSKTKIAGPAAAASAVPGAKSSRKKDDDVDTSPLLPLNNLKTQRVNDELKLRVLKWNFAVPRDEFVDQLKEQMNTAGVNKSLMTNMFHVDFKFHLKAIESLNEDLSVNVESQKANLDLILKWMTLRFFDTNPSVLLKGLEYLQSVFSLLAQEGYHMLDSEASSFIPYLITKVGDPKDAVKNSVHGIFKTLWRIYPASKLFPYAMEGIKTKNARQRTECLEELGSLIEEFGVAVCQPSPSVALKEVAKQIADRDNAVRSAALNCIVHAYCQEGEKVYKLIGQLSEKDMSLLEERIKRSAKNRPAPGAAPVKTAVTPTPNPGPTSPDTRSGLPVRGARPASAYYASDNKNTRVEVAERPQARPISGVFAMELEQTVQKAAGLRGHVNSSIHLDLVQVNFDDILNEAVPMPRYKRTAVGSSQAADQFGKINSTDPALDINISQIAHPSLNVSLNAVQYVENVINKSADESWLETRVDQILIGCTMQLRLLYQSQDRSLKDIIQGYKALLRLLMALFVQSNLAQRGSRDVLRDLANLSLHVMLDSRLETADDADQVVRALNVLVLKMVEKSDHTAMTSALLRLLHDAVGSDNSNGKYIELVMKCLWRIVRNLNDWINTINISTILVDLHAFLKAYPSSVWKDRQSDTPIRTIKTIIHTLVRLQGDAILSNLGAIDNLKDSELEPYLQKLLKSGVSKEKDSASKLPTSDQLSGVPEKKDGSVKIRRLSKSTQETLTAIFRKIGSKELSQEGLAQLYDFKQRYPDADIEPFLSRSSDFFKNYIERGLKFMEEKKRKELAEGLLTPDNNNPVEGGLVQQSSSSESGVNPDAYRERLKKLRALAGLETSHVTSSNASSTINQFGFSSSSVTVTQTRTVTAISGDFENVPVVQNVTTTTSSSATSGIEDYRRRLEMLKSGGNLS
ncbi:cytoskeleton-associated protein 5 [Daphnia magna]|uniref:cytoskeleton-associated protein 5 n=1 Tax=Daphnia magna TaxID=35525 RepID=UPI001E1BC930|nr:cytoskeleton-associated protein 5 [Daphnia magna]XP_045035690.1 cytoskeleton-associated protein 5 [Daphnia magna]XP_045035691.1 cytoskeleton-associated protein 5 [Daphnia magna]